MNPYFTTAIFAATLACRNCDEMDVFGANGGDQLLWICPNPLGYKTIETVSADGNDYVLYGERMGQIDG